MFSINDATLPVYSATAGEPRRKAQIGRSSEVSLKVMEQDINNLTASIRSPSGREEPCLLKRLANGHLGRGHGGCNTVDQISLYAEMSTGAVKL